VSTTDQIIEREAILRLISKSAIYGNLGFFIGAGFTKAVLDEGEFSRALAWGELLERCADKLNVKYADVPKEGVSYPSIASAICEEYASTKGIDFSGALSELKQLIAGLTAWCPDEKQRAEFAPHLKAFSPSWIITTNYDLVLEILLAGKAIPLGPSDSLSAPAGMIPIFHLHGIRTNPNELIIAEQDYVALFRPNQYRQMKLALTVRESTTVILGYGLGDVNVLTAMDWSKSVFENQSANYPSGVFQVLRKGTAAKIGPYVDRNGVQIIEVHSISSFFAELGTVFSKEKSLSDKRNEAMALVTEMISQKHNGNVAGFVDDAAYRTKMLELLTSESDVLSGAFEGFLLAALDETTLRSNKSGAFYAYNQTIEIVFDLLSCFSVGEFPPALLHAAAASFNKVLPSVGTGFGEAWEAAKTLDRRKGEISTPMRGELLSICAQYSLIYLEGWLK
jgi:SIR2-like domain